MKYVLIILAFICSYSVRANEVNIELKNLAQQYFTAMVASQSPTASEKELEDYLVLLTDDVGHQHLPYQTDDARTPDGKVNMRQVHIPNIRPRCLIPSSSMIRR